jgi:hypothetical protein
MMALKSAICLHERHPSHPRTVPALVCIFKRWIELRGDKEKLIACLGGDERLVPVVEHEMNEVLKCPDSVEAIEAGAFALNESYTYEKNDGKNSALEYCLEKQKMKKHSATGLEDAALVHADFIKALTASDR